ncbi:MAG: hypothetical protein ABEK04_04895 [Candidatus Nanohalobium sp.]
MVSLIDALFIMPTAFFAVGFIVPGLIMSQQAGEKFRKATSLGISDTVAQNFAIAFLQARKNGHPNLRQAAEEMSGREKPFNRKLLTYHPEMFSYFKISFNSPFDNKPAQCDRIPTFLSAKQGEVLDNSCDFAFEGAGGREFGKDTRHFRLTVPVRGGNAGVMDLAYQVQ